MNQDPSHDTMLTVSAPSTAGQKPAIVKFGRTQATRLTMPAFTTSRNRPSVTIVIGKVSTTAIGRTTAFTTPSSAAAISSVPVLVMEKPPTHREASQRPPAAISARRMKPVISSSPCPCVFRDRL